MPLLSSSSLLPRESAPNDSPSLPAAIVAFNLLSLFGFVSLLAILVTVFFAGLQRVRTWHAYIFAWMIFCLTPLPVLGRQTHREVAPEFIPCVLDAALMYASRPFAGFATLSFILQLYLNVSARLSGKFLKQQYIVILLAIPPVFWVGTFVWTLISGLLHVYPVELEPGGFYCHLDSPVPSGVVAMLVLFDTLAVVVVEILTAVLIAKHWRAFRALQKRNEPGVSLSIIIRFFIFALLPLIAMGLSITAYIPGLVAQFFTAYNMLMAILPVAAALIFGSEPDILRVWMFWRDPLEEHQASEKAKAKDFDRMAGSTFSDTFA